MLKIYIDEAGRGPLAGPLYVGLILPMKRFVKKEYKDSKKLTTKKRAFLFDKIQNLEKKGSIITGTGIVTAQEIDACKITASISLAIRRGLLEVFSKVFAKELVNKKVYCSCDVNDRMILHNYLKTLTISNFPQIVEKIEQFFSKIELIIDGNTDFGLEKSYGLDTTTIIKGDEKNSYIAMASILAKVLRDRYMTDIADPQYSEYGFAKHMGYGTQYHRQQIQKLGPCILHRKLFLRKMNESGEKNILI